MTNLAIYGDLVGIRRLIDFDRRFLLFLDEITCIGASHNHMAIVEWGYNLGYKDIQEMAENAAIAGHMSIIKWCDSKGGLNYVPIIIWGREHPHVVQWCNAKGIFLQHESITNALDRLYRQKYMHHIIAYHQRIHDIFFPNEVDKKFVLTFPNHHT
jgi:hypothetical protein